MDSRARAGVGNHHGGHPLRGHLVEAVAFTADKSTADGGRKFLLPVQGLLEGY